MSSSVGQITSLDQNDNSSVVKNVVYGSVVAVVALAIIFGVLIVLAEHHLLSWEPMKQVADFLADYAIIPLAASSALLALLVIGGIWWKCSKPQEIDELPPPSPPPASVTLDRKYPTGPIQKEDHKGKRALPTFAHVNRGMPDPRMRGFYDLTAPPSAYTQQTRQQRADGRIDLADIAPLRSSSSDEETHSDEEAPAPRRKQNSILTVFDD